MPPTISKAIIQRYPKGFLVRSVLAHNVIFTEGEQGDTAYILAEGEVEISTTVSERKKVLAMLHPISLFGEMALFLDEQKRTATAVATRDSQIVVVTRDALDEYLESAPQVISSIISVLVHRLKSTTKKASKVPNTALGICRVLNLFALNGHMELKYDSAVRSLAETFLQPPDTIEHYLLALEQDGALAIKRDGERRVIHLVDRDFLTRAMGKPRSQP